jgi:hypothetical protein
MGMLVYEDFLTQSSTLTGGRLGSDNAYEQPVRPPPSLIRGGVQWEMAGCTTTDARIIMLARDSPVAIPRFAHDAWARARLISRAKSGTLPARMRHTRAPLRTCAYVARDPAHSCTLVPRLAPNLDQRNFR